MSSSDFRLDPRSEQAQVAASRRSSVSRLAGQASRERRANSVGCGADLKDQLPAFPESRKCRDVFFALLFIASVLAIVISGWVYSSSLLNAVNVAKTTTTTAVPGSVLKGSISEVVVRRLTAQVTNSSVEAIRQVVVACTVGGLAGFAASYLWLGLMRSYPTTALKIAIWSRPFCLLGLAGVFIGLGFYLRNEMSKMLFITAVGFCLAGICSLCYAFIASRFVDFSSQVLRAVAEVTSRHPGMILVALSGSVLSIAWILLCMSSWAAILVAHQEKVEKNLAGSVHWMIFLFALTLYWGCMVMSNVPCVANAGVFGRWYFGQDREGANIVAASLRDATTTSFGSICFGSLIVAVLRAIEKVADYAQREAAEERNVVFCIIACCLHCVIRCVGDIIVYLNAWAYVQCAVRNASFTDAARITFSLCTCASIPLLTSELLVSWCANFGTILAILTGLCTGALVVLAMGGTVYSAAAAAVLSCLAAVCIGSIISDIMDTGCKAVLVLWAENDGPLKQSHRELTKAFEDKVRDGLAEIQDQEAQELAAQSQPPASPSGAAPASPHTPNGGAASSA